MKKPPFLRSENTSTPQSMVPWLTDSFVVGIHVRAPPLVQPYDRLLSISAPLPQWVAHILPVLQHEVVVWHRLHLLVVRNRTGSGPVGEGPAVSRRHSDCGFYEWTHHRLPTEYRPNSCSRHAASTPAAALLLLKVAWTRNSGIAMEARALLLLHSNRWEVSRPQLFGEFGSRGAAPIANRNRDYS